MIHCLVWFLKVSLNLIHRYDFFSQKKIVIFSLCLTLCNLLQSKKLEIQGFAQVYSELFWCFYHELMELCRLIYCRYIPHLRGKNSHSDIIEWVDPQNKPMLYIHHQIWPRSKYCIDFNSLLQITSFHLASMDGV